MRDKLIIGAIVVVQLLVSLLCMWLAFLIPYGGSHPLLGAYAGWGLISALALVSGKVLPRIVALLWHAIFVGYILISSIGGSPLNQGDRIVRIVGFCDLFSVLYLTRAAITYFRNRTAKPQPPAKDSASRNGS